MNRKILCFHNYETIKVERRYYKYMKGCIKTLKCKKCGKLKKEDNWE